MARFEIVRRARRFAFFLITAVAVVVAGSATAQAAPPAGSWELNFVDEFNTPGLNTSKWNPAWNGGADGNGTSDISGECPSPEMASQPGDGYLHLAVKATPITCKYFNPGTQKLETISRSARGGVVSSESKYHFSYGYVEWRVVVPGATKSGYSCAAGGCIANWPSFWSRSVGGLTEIDVVDTLDEGKASWKYHRFYPGPHVEWGETPTTAIGQGGGVHTYAAQWEPGVVTWYYDGQKVYELPWSQVTSEQHYLLASYLPTRAGAKWGPPLVPAEAKVDYVKVWQHPKPTVTTDPPTEVGPSTAKFNGSVYTNGTNTSYYFQYGQTTSYGSTAPVPPGTNIGDGAGYKYAWNNVSGLNPGTTYHYRIVATNATGTSYGVDREFKTSVEPPGVFFSDATNSNTISKGVYSSTSGWQQTPFWGHPAAAGTTPEFLTINGAPHVFFVDAANNNTISYWTLTPTGWQQVFLGGHRVANGSSPSAVMVNGIPHVFFVDAANNNTITDWTWTPATSWNQNFFWGHSVTAGSSPSAIMKDNAALVYFSDANNSNTISSWSWGSSVVQTHYWGHSLTPGSSPSVIMKDGTALVYFSDANNSNTISSWSWGSGGLVQVPYWGHSLTPGSSPMPIIKDGTVLIYFSDANNSNTISSWSWGSSLVQVPYWGHSLTPGSSPSVITKDGTVYVYFSDANNSNKLALWKWDASLQQILLNSGSLTSGSSPATG